ncbi:MAG: RDD family protein, partial [Anaerolineae bacterium]|nr:RDD family protein [Anaerolineae bacterium]
VYTWFFLAHNNGQTPGKMLLGIRVVGANGGGVSDLQAILRYVGYYINTFLCFVGWIYAFINPDQRGFHDMIAGTRVVE